MVKLKKHSFFKHSDWEDLLAKKPEPPKPIADLPKCSNFTYNVYQYNELNERILLDAVDPENDIFRTWF